MEDGSEAPRRGGVSAKRNGAKPTGGAKRPHTKTVRVQLHLGATTAERLGVHAALCHQDKSKLADTILTGWLARYGKGKELFDPADPALLGSEAEALIE
jgi:hypothetical protein